MFVPSSSLADGFEPSDTQYNYSAPTAFRLVIFNLPGVEFNCQMVKLPRFASKQTPTIATPFNDYPVVGTETSYDELAVTFLVDEKLNNYKSVHNWMKGIYFPQSHDQFRNYVDKKKSIHPTVNPLDTEAKLSSDMHLLTLDSAGNVVSTIKFIGAFPTSLEGLPFDVTVSSTYNYFTAVAGFSYAYYEIE